MRRLCIAATACLLLPGCAPVLIGAAAGGAYTSLEDRRTAGVQIDDEGIELRVGNRIGDRFADRVHVSVTSYNRSVLLTGEVPNEATRAQVEKFARDNASVRAVTNDLQIAAPSSLGSRANDSLITSRVKARLLESTRVNALHVKVVTEAGVVYLLGIVTEAEANEAVEIARTTAGVIKVVKVFEYCAPGDPVCRVRTEQRGA